ncbi:hypothetical protein RHECNPAF_280049 [Rhizobium etli CNPAF512]|nr:hypothetical protein RHECNPAF_280049 [Rhizobium etli CNPAF512]
MRIPECGEHHPEAISQAEIIPYSILPPDPRPPLGLICHHAFPTPPILSVLTWWRYRSINRFYQSLNCDEPCLSRRCMHSAVDSRLNWD